MYLVTLHHCTWQNRNKKVLDIYTLKTAGSKTTQLGSFLIQLTGQIGTNARFGYFNARNLVMNVDP